MRIVNEITKIPFCMPDFFGPIVVEKKTATTAIQYLDWKIHLSFLSMLFLLYNSLIALVLRTFLQQPLNSLNKNTRMQLCKNRSLFLW